MKLKIRLLDDIEKISGILIKNGYQVNRVSIKKGKSTEQGIEILGDGEIQKVEDDE